MRKTNFLGAMVLLFTFLLFTGCACNEIQQKQPTQQEAVIQQPQQDLQEQQDWVEAIGETPEVYIDGMAKEVTLVRVKDGDTIVVNDGVTDITVRLIGIDTPESVHPDKSRNTEQGKTASEYTKSLLSNYTTLYLEHDQEIHDKYGRTLAYVWLSPDTSDYNNMLNYRLVKEGQAIPKAYPPNTRYKDVLESAV